MREKCRKIIYFSEEDSEESVDSEDDYEPDTEWSDSSSESDDEVEDSQKQRKPWKWDELNELQDAFHEELQKKVYPSQEKIRRILEAFNYTRLQRRGAQAIIAKFQHLKNKNWVF